MYIYGLMDGQADRIKERRGTEGEQREDERAEQDSETEEEPGKQRDARCQMPWIPHE